MPWFWYVWDWEVWLAPNWGYWGIDVWTEDWIDGWKLVWEVDGVETCCWVDPEAEP